MHVAPLVSMEPATKAVDLSFNLGSFADTTATVAAVTPKGVEFLGAMFGAGCRSIELPKSRAEDFARFASQKGVGV